ncbi:MAG: hypothetical protein IJC92_04285 [Bacteroidaceae bacterium]|nr:hypothetical protein [Bacteroidaceae bacterium]
MKHKNLGAKSATVACYKIENRAIVKHICGKNHKSPTQTEQRNRKQTDEHPIGKTKLQKATPVNRRSRKANKHITAKNTQPF